jgi:rhodanese-related sulfurtransferase
VGTLVCAAPPHADFLCLRREEVIKVRRQLRDEVDTVRTARSQYTPVPVPRITKEDLKQQLDSGTPPVVVDARLKYPYEHSTLKLPGAIRIGAGATMPSLPRDREIVVYDSDPHELASSDVAAALIRQGYRAVALAGGIADWVAANLPTETKEAPKQAAPEPGALKG